MNIIELSLKTRSLLENDWKSNILLQNKLEWHKLCSSLDLLEDTQVAIDHYFDLPEFTAETGGYLYLYGLLQAFFMQQDAIQNIASILAGKTIDWKKDYPNVFIVRETRNNAVGHPTSRQRGKEQSCHYITRISLCNKSFRFMSFFHRSNTEKYETIKLEPLRKNQQEAVILILNDIINYMEQDWEKHKLKFRGDSIADKATNLRYNTSKLLEEVRHRNITPFQFHLDIIKGKLDDVKQAANDRYVDYKAVETLNDTLRIMDGIVERITGWYNADAIYQNFDAEIFIHHLNDRVEELKEVLKEIDEEFNE